MIPIEKSPLVSVIIPTYNRENFIKATLDTLLLQTYKNWEAIIVDDGSTDKTSLIVKEYIKNDNRFKYIYQTNKGSSSARNVGLDAAQGQYIQFLDSDDLILPEKLNKQIKLIITTNSDICYCYWEPLVENNINRKRIDKLQNIPEIINKKFYLTILNGWGKYFVIPPHCFLFSKKSISEIRFDERLQNNVDFDFLFRVSYFNNCFCVLKEKFAIYRIHANSICSKNNTFAGRLKMYKKIIINRTYDYKTRLFALKIMRWQLQIIFINKIKRYLKLFKF